VRGGVWSAPGRIDIIGEHTDYSGGFAPARRTVVRARPRADGRIAAVSAGYGAVEFPAATVPGEVTGWGAHARGERVRRRARRRHGPDGVPPRRRCSSARDA